MTLGGFTAEDSRRLFEALCRALESPIFETAAHPASTSKQSERAHTAPDLNPSLKPAWENFRPMDKVKSC